MKQYRIPVGGILVRCFIFILFSLMTSTKEVKAQQTCVNANSLSSVESCDQALTFQPQTGFFLGGFFTNTSNNAIAGTDDDAIYQTEINGGFFTFQDNVANGTYMVKLLFAETFHNTSGARLFDVIAEGSIILDDFDIFDAAGGANTAYCSTHSVTVSDGTLSVTFSNVVDFAKINGICYWPAGNTPPEVSISGPADGTTVNFGTTVNLTGSATDADEGTVTSKIAWESSLDGALSGSGGSVMISNLSVGTHQIQAIVTDVGGLTGGDCITVTVNPFIPGGSACINSGGTAFNGTISYQADDYFGGGNTASTANAIASTTDDPVFQTERFGEFSYNFPIDNGNYTVDLFFAEFAYTLSGLRVFDVAIEGNTVLDEYDIVAEVGSFTATSETFNNIVVADGNLTVTLSKGAGNLDQPKISGICFGAISAILPVELVQFRGTVRFNQAILTWKTATETNNKGFHIQKSLDGRKFETIGFVRGSGTSYIEQTYSFTDKRFTSSAYYRLHQQDFDGTSEDSKTLYLLQQSPEEGFSIYPNPAKDNIQIDIHGFSETKLVEPMVIQIISIEGGINKIIGNDILLLQQSVNNYFQSLPAGIYIIEAIINGKPYRKKLVKSS